MSGRIEAVIAGGDINGASLPARNHQTEHAGTARSGNTPESEQ
jgi:hypothetical protein